VWTNYRTLVKARRIKASGLGIFVETLYVDTKF